MYSRSAKPAGIQQEHAEDNGQLILDFSMMKMFLNSLGIEYHRFCHMINECINDHLRCVSLRNKGIIRRLLHYGIHVFHRLGHYNYVQESLALC